jgi:DNA-binding response OmpR family regulator
VRHLDILVVDDERDLASGVADMLEADGHRVILAHSAEAALDLAQARAFDMVFLDVKLPGVTGVDILLPLRRALPGKRIVPMTGYRIDNLIATVVGDDNFMVLSTPQTDARVAEQLHRLGPGGMLVVLDSAGLLGPRLADRLGERGEVVCLARAEAEALEAGPFSGSDVLVLDLGRTVARGLEAYLAVREGGSNPKTIIIARIPGDDEETVNPLRSVSVAGCLFKPLDPEELLEIVSAPPQPPIRTAG